DCWLWPASLRARELPSHPSSSRLGPPNTGGRVAMSSMSTGLSRQEKRAQPSPSVAPLAVKPLEAARLLSLSLTKIYMLMRSGELRSYRDGRARRIMMSSIHEHMARRLADDIAPRQKRSRRGLWAVGERRSVEGACVRHDGRALAQCRSTGPKQARRWSWR